MVSLAPLINRPDNKSCKKMPRGVHQIYRGISSPLEPINCFDFHGTSPREHSIAIIYFIFYICILYLYMRSLTKRYYIFHSLLLFHKFVSFCYRRSMRFCFLIILADRYAFIYKTGDMQKREKYMILIKI